VLAEKGDEGERAAMGKGGELGAMGKHQGDGAAWLGEAPGCSAGRQSWKKAGCARLGKNQGSAQRRIRGGAPASSRTGEGERGAPAVRRRGLALERERGREKEEEDARVKRIGRRGRRDFSSTFERRRR
jgi:hypothetical protein